VDDGQTKEEWKGIAETNKILGLAPGTIKVDGVCVRVSSMRCHSQALTIKLKDKTLSIDKIAKIIQNGNEWVELIDNNKTETLSKLTPVAINGSLKIGVGRLKKMNIGEEYISLFTVGDQLLWGAAEPIRRMLKIIVDYHG
jgi:aspartate-semialdehyde dehydrogenase